MKPYRVQPSPMHRRAQPDANIARKLWRELAADAVRLAIGAGDGGEAWSEPLHFRMALKTAPAFPAPLGDGMALALDRAFRAVAEAMLCAGTPERRARVAPLLAEAGRTIDALLDDVIAPELALSRRIAGDTEED